MFLIKAISIFSIALVLSSRLSLPFFSLNPKMLSPKSSFHLEETAGSQKPNSWETLIQSAPDYYAANELQARVQALKKALPLVKQKVREQLNLSNKEIVAIFATGDYLLDPSWNTPGLPQPPESLDFIVFVDPSPGNTKEKPIKIEIEIQPETFFAKNDLGHQSAHHLKLTVTSNSDINNPQSTQAYYLGYLLEGKFPWKEKPSLTSLQKLIRNLYSTTLEKGTFDAVVGTKEAVIAKLLTDHEVPAAFQTTFAGKDPALLRKIQAVFTPQHQRPSSMEASL